MSANLTEKDQNVLKDKSNAANASATIAVASTDTAASVSASSAAPINKVERNLNIKLSDNLEFLICEVCTSEPRRGGFSTLPCGHSMCMGCLEGISKALTPQQEEEYTKKYGEGCSPCPTCREPYNTAAQKPNFALKNLIRSIKEGVNTGAMLKEIPVLENRLRDAEKATKEQKKEQERDAVVEEQRTRNKLNEEIEQQSIENEIKARRRDELKAKLREREARIERLKKEEKKLKEELEGKKKKNKPTIAVTAKTKKEKKLEDLESDNKKLREIQDLSRQLLQRTRAKQKSNQSNTAANLSIAASAAASAASRAKDNPIDSVTSDRMAITHSSVNTKRDLLTEKPIVYDTDLMQDFCMSICERLHGLNISDLEWDKGLVLIFSNRKGNRGGVILDKKYWPMFLTRLSIFAGKNIEAQFDCAIYNTKNAWFLHKKDQYGLKQLMNPKVNTEIEIIVTSDPEHPMLDVISRPMKEKVSAMSTPASSAATSSETASSNIDKIMEIASADWRKNDMGEKPLSSIHTLYQHDNAIKDFLNMMGAKLDALNISQLEWENGLILIFSTQKDKKGGVILDLNKYWPVLEARLSWFSPNKFEASHYAVYSTKHAWLIYTSGHQSVQYDMDGNKITTYVTDAGATKIEVIVTGADDPVLHVISRPLKDKTTPQAPSTIDGYHPPISAASANTTAANSAASSVQPIAKPASNPNFAAKMAFVKNFMTEFKKFVKTEQIQDHEWEAGVAVFFPDDLLKSIILDEGIVRILENGQGIIKDNKLHLRLVTNVRDIIRRPKQIIVMTKQKGSTAAYEKRTEIDITSYDPIKMQFYSRPLHRKISNDNNISNVVGDVRGQFFEKSKREPAPAILNNTANSQSSYFDINKLMSMPPLTDHKPIPFSRSQRLTVCNQLAKRLEEVTQSEWEHGIRLVFSPYRGVGVKVDTETSMYLIEVLNNLYMESQKSLKESWESPYPTPNHLFIYKSKPNKQENDQAAVIDPNKVTVIVIKNYNDPNIEVEFRDRPFAANPMLLSGSASAATKPIALPGASKTALSKDIDVGAYEPLPFTATEQRSFCEKLAKELKAQVKPNEWYHGVRLIFSSYERLEIGVKLDEGIINKLSWILNEEIYKPDLIAEANATKDLIVQRKEFPNRLFIFEAKRNTSSKLSPDYLFSSEELDRAKMTTIEVVSYQEGYIKFQTRPLEQAKLKDNLDIPKEVPKNPWLLSSAANAAAKGSVASATTSAAASASSMTGNFLANKEGANSAYNKVSLEKRIDTAGELLQTYFKAAGGIEWSTVHITIPGLMDAACNLNSLIADVQARGPKSDGEVSQDYRDKNLDDMEKKQLVEVAACEKIIMKFFNKTNLKQKAQTQINEIKACFAEAMLEFKRVVTCFRENAASNALSTDNSSRTLLQSSAVYKAATAASASASTTRAAAEAHINYLPLPVTIHPKTLASTLANQLTTQVKSNEWEYVVKLIFIPFHVYDSKGKYIGLKIEKNLINSLEENLNYNNLDNMGTKEELCVEVPEESRPNELIIYKHKNILATGSMKYTIIKVQNWTQDEPELVFAERPHATNPRLQNSSASKDATGTGTSSTASAITTAAASASSVAASASASTDTVPTTTNNAATGSHGTAIRIGSDTIPKNTTLKYTI